MEFVSCFLEESLTRGILCRVPIGQLRGLHSHDGRILGRAGALAAVARRRRRRPVRSRHPGPRARMRTVRVNRHLQGLPGAGALPARGHRNLRLVDRAVRAHAQRRAPGAAVPGRRRGRGPEVRGGPVTVHAAVQAAHAARAASHRVEPVPLDVAVRTDDACGMQRTKA